MSSTEARLAGSDGADAVGTGGGRGADGTGHGLARAAGAEISKCNAGARMEGGLGRDAEVAPLLTAEAPQPAPPPMSQQQPATPSLPQPPAQPRTQQHWQPESR